jgi:glycosyltransferase involved in cell wall biosynthesis
MTAENDVRILIVHQNRDILLTVLARILSWRFFKLIYVQHMQLGMAKRDLFHTWEYGKLDAWIAPLPGFLVSLKERTRLDPNKVHIIPFGIETDRFAVNPADKAQARRELELPDKAAIAGVVGRLDPKKGQDVLIRACAGLHRAGINLHVLIVGDRTMGEAARYASELKDLTEQLELTPYVHFRPHQEKVEIVYGAMDVFVLPSQSETYGMVTLEAMAAGVPVIGTCSGGTPEIIDDEINGLLFAPGDDDALARALKSTLEDVASAEKRVQRARKDVVENYSHTRQCRLMETLFDQLIA